jgi:hypothetical protein
MNQVERDLLAHCRSRLLDASTRRDDPNETPWLTVLHVTEILLKLQRGDFSG